MERTSTREMVPSSSNGHACSSFARGFVCARCPDVDTGALLSRWPLVSFAARRRTGREEKRERPGEKEPRKLVAC